jgi:hypothetical protein
LALADEIKTARKVIVADGYDMSVGELMNLYRDNDDTRKTRFIESLLLGIPVPPIFVFQDEKGVWELIDGLQRLSTIFQFTGLLKGERADNLGVLSLSGTNFLPSLEGRRWQPSSAKSTDGIGPENQLEIKRARLRIEILKKESDPLAKFELFQRLNTGGASLSEQEVRNCTAVMMNKAFFDWLVKCSTNADFVTTTCQTDAAIEAQAGVELVLRLLAFRNVPYTNGLDVHEYLDKSLLDLATRKSFSLTGEGDVFRKTFAVLNSALGDAAFKRWDGQAFKGKFLMSVFEVMATGVSKNIKAISSIPDAKRKTFLTNKAKSLWSNAIFTANSGAGVRGTTRLSNLIPMSESFLKP